MVFSMIGLLYKSFLVTVDTGIVSCVKSCTVDTT